MTTPTNNNALQAIHYIRQAQANLDTAARIARPLDPKAAAMLHGHADSLEPIITKLATMEPKP